jgi:uncharacterized protein
MNHFKIFSLKNRQFVSIRVANSFISRARGLLFSSRLKENEGIWIIPCSSIHTFFMSYPIDVVFLDKYGVVEKIIEQVTPFSLSICNKAHSVVEFKSGFTKKNNILVGDYYPLTKSITTTNTVAIAR